MDVLCNVHPTTAAGGATRGRAPLLLPPDDPQGVPVVLAVPLGSIESLSAVRTYIPQDLRPQEARALAVKALAEVLRRCEKQGGEKQGGEKQGVPLLDPWTDCKVEDDKARKLFKKMQQVEGALRGHALLGMGEREALLARYQHKAVCGLVGRSVVGVVVCVYVCICMCVMWCVCVSYTHIYIYIYYVCDTYRHVIPYQRHLSTHHPLSYPPPPPPPSHKQRPSKSKLPLPNGTSKQQVPSSSVMNLPIENEF